MSIQLQRLAVRGSLPAPEFPADIHHQKRNRFASETSYVSYRKERYAAAAVAAAVGALLALPRLYDALRERLEERLDARRRRLPRTRARSSLPAGRAGEGSDEVPLERVNAPFCNAHSFHKAVYNTIYLISEEHRLRLENRIVKRASVR